jgi:hypothetical protein
MTKGEIHSEKLSFGSAVVDFRSTKLFGPIGNNTLNTVLLL